MNIFYKRPLALILCIGLGGFFLFSIQNTLLRIVLCVLAALPCIISLFIDKSKWNTKLNKAITVILFLSYLLSFIYFDLTFNIYDKYDTEVEIEGIVEEVSQSSSYSMRLLIRVERINGKRANYNVYAYPTKAEATGIIEGTRIKFFATLGGFSKESRIYNISKGINAYANDIRDIEILEYTSGRLAAKLRQYRLYLSRRITLLTDKDSGALLSALLLGERDLLPSQLKLSFKRIGISHILALSGMHLAILSLGIGWILTKLKVKKKLRVSIIMAFILIYMALTGFSVSVCRAGIMIILAYLLFLLERPKDSLTSLSLAVVIICLFTPYAVYDVSLWLSALATFGIIACAEYIAPQKNADTRKLLRYIGLSFLTSMFAVSSTILISSYTFGGISILSLPATLIFSLIAEIIMYLGCLIILIGWLLPIGFIVSPFTRLLSALAELLASYKFAYVSSNFVSVKIIVVIYTVLFFLLITFKVKKRKLWSSILIAAFCLIMIIPTLMTYRENRTDTVAYYGQSKSDMMLIRSEGEVCLINSSQYSKSTAYNALDLLEGTHTYLVDKYYYTHYSWSIDDELDVLLSSISISEIYMPTPRNEDEKTILKVVLATIKDSDAEVVLFREYETVSIGKYTVNLLYSAPYGQTSANAFVVANGETVYTYLSSGLLSKDTSNEYMKYLELTDYLILGDHGPKYKTKVYLEKSYEELKSIVLHSDNIFLKQSNMLYFIEKGCKIYSHPEGIVYLK